MDFAPYDRRHYPTLEVVAGYSRWARTYDRTAYERLDLGLLARAAPLLSGRAEAADLACGTGRIGVWLRAQGIAAVDGVDLTPAMLAQAEAKGAYRHLSLADATRSGLASAAYDLCVCSMAVCHLPGLAAFYAEAARLLRPGGVLIVVDFHPFAMLQGVPTHFDEADGTATAIRNHVHLFSDHMAAALAAGLGLQAMDECVVGTEWIAEQPSMQRYAGQPLSFLLAWTRV